MSVYADIRGAIQALAITASGFPATNQIAYEGRVFNNTPGTPYARLTLLPGTGGPLALSGLRNLRGMFQVDVYVPSTGNPGTANIDAIADAVIALFYSGRRIRQGSTIVIIEYAQRAPLVMSEGWISVPITIGWRAFVA